MSERGKQQQQQQKEEFIRWSTMTEHIFQHEKRNYGNIRYQSNVKKDQDKGMFCGIGKINQDIGLGA